MNVIFANDGIKNGLKFGPYDYAYIAGGNIMALSGATILTLARVTIEHSDTVNSNPVKWELTEAASNLFKGSKFSMVYFIRKDTEMNI